MVDKNQVITVGLVVLIVAAVVFGLAAISNITGNTITGSVADDGPVVEQEYFKIDGQANECLSDSNNSEVKNGEGRCE